MSTAFDLLQGIRETQQYLDELTFEFNVKRIDPWKDEEQYNEILGKIQRAEKNLKELNDAADFFIKDMRG